MKLSSIIKILIKAVVLPIIAMFMLNKWNLCEYITFIPEDYRFEAGLALYMAILEAVAGHSHRAGTAEGNAEITAIGSFLLLFSAFQRNAQPSPQVMISGVWGRVTNKHLAEIPGTGFLLNTQSYGRLHCLPVVLRAFDRELLKNNYGLSAL